jgi:hypothetical protein
LSRIPEHWGNPLARTDFGDHYETVRYTPRNDRVGIDTSCAAGIKAAARRLPGHHFPRKLSHSSACLPIAHPFRDAFRWNLRQTWKTGGAARHRPACRAASAGQLARADDQITNACPSRISRATTKVKGINKHAKGSTSLKRMRCAAKERVATDPRFGGNALDQHSLADPCLTLNQQGSGRSALHRMDQLSAN